jgi:hypothetical protein
MPQNILVFLSQASLHASRQVVAQLREVLQPAEVVDFAETLAEYLSSRRLPPSEVGVAELSEAKALFFQQATSQSETSRIHINVTDAIRLRGGFEVVPVNKSQLVKLNLAAIVVLYTEPTETLKQRPFERAGSRFRSLSWGCRLDYKFLLRVPTRLSWGCPSCSLI